MRADTRLDITIAALCTRHQFTRTPAVVVEQLRTLGADSDVSASVGRWIGYYDSVDRAPLIGALRDAFTPDQSFVDVGRKRRGLPIHGTAGFINPHVSEKRVTDSR